MVNLHIACILSIFLRRPKKPILDNEIIWRTFYVNLVFVVFMLGNMQWTRVQYGFSHHGDEVGRSVAMTTLVTAQVRPSPRTH